MITKHPMSASIAPNQCGTSKLSLGIQQVARREAHLRRSNFFGWRIRATGTDRTDNSLELQVSAALDCLSDDNK